MARCPSWMRPGRGVIELPHANQCNRSRPVERQPRLTIKDLARRDGQVTLRAMKGARGLLLIACLLLAAPAAAGTLYRCDSADGGAQLCQQARRRRQVRRHQHQQRPAAPRAARRAGLAAAGRASTASAPVASPPASDVPAAPPAASMPSPPPSPGAGRRGSCRAGLFLHQGRRAPLHQQGARRAWPVPRRCAPSATASSKPATPAAPPGRQFRHPAPEHLRLFRRDPQRRAPVRRRRSGGARDHPCRIGLQPQRAVARRRAGPDAADAGHRAPVRRRQRLRRRRRTSRAACSTWPGC